MNDLLDIPGPSNPGDDDAGGGGGSGSAMAGLAIVGAAIGWMIA